MDITLFIINSEICCRIARRDELSVTEGFPHLVYNKTFFDSEC